jgi:hypothetical protein
MSRPYARYYNYIIFADSETDHKEVADPEQDIKTDYTNKIDFDVTSDKYYYHAETEKWYLTWSYVWYTITIGRHGKQYHYFRTRQQLLKYISKLHGNILIYFHNLSYDFSYLNAGNILESLGDIKINCAYSAVKPLMITVNKKIEIRDSLRLFNKSIREIGNELNLPKLEYNYNGERYCNTPLDKNEIEYGFRDVEILYKKFTSDFKIPEYCKKRGYNMSKIPLTSTGAIRTDIQSEKFIKPIFKTFSKHKKQCKDINEFLQDLNNFNFVYSGYIGGCVYTDFSTLGKIQENVKSIDLTSSYPSSMIFGYYPVSQPRYISQHDFYMRYLRLKNITFNDIVKYGFSMLYDRKLGGLYRVKVADVKLKTHYNKNIFPFITYGITEKNLKTYCNTLQDISDIEKYTTTAKNAKYVNRKLLKAETIVITLNTIDFWLFLQNYEFSGIEFVNGIEFKVDYNYYFHEIVKKYIVQKSFHKKMISDIESNKITFDDLPNYQNEYGKETPENITALNNFTSYDEKLKYLKTTLYTVQDKGGLNGLYGINVMDPLIDEFETIENGQLEKSGNKLQLKDTTCFLMGMFITSYSRLQLYAGFNVCNDLKIKHYYTDTDSLKTEENEKIIETANKYLYGICKLQNKKQNYFYKNFGLCQFDNDGYYNKFISNGSKSYIVEHDNKIKVTISGLSQATEIFNLYYKNHTFEETVNKLYQPNTIFCSDITEFTKQLQHLQTETGILLLYTPRKINGIADINKIFFDVDENTINKIKLEDLTT